MSSGSPRRRPLARGVLITAAITTGVTAAGACRRADPPRAPGNSGGPAASPSAPPPAPAAATADTTPRPCGDALRPAVLSGDAGAGQRGITYTLTNTGPAPCTVRGHPRVTFADSAGRPPAGLVVDTVQADAPPDAAATPIAPGEQATFALTYTAVPMEGRPCARPATLTVTPPGATRGTTFPARFEVCGEGRVRVRPVATGFAAAVGSYADTVRSVGGAARLVTLRLDADGSAALEAGPLGATAGEASARGRWAVRDGVLEVRVPGAAPRRWAMRAGRLVPLAWDAGRDGPAGRLLRRRD